MLITNSKHFFVVQNMNHQRIMMQVKLQQAAAEKEWLEAEVFAASKPTPWLQIDFSRRIKDGTEIKSQVC